MTAAHPILSCEQARELEAHLFGGDETREWPAMLAAGRGVARQIERDYLELGGLPRAASLLVLAGKGHNAGDALIAAKEILTRRSDARCDVVFALGERALKPLAARAWRDLRESCAGRVTILADRPPPPGGRYDLCIDGIFGFQFRPPLDEPTLRLLRWESELSVRFRAAIDLPSGLDAPGAFRADFTYATGSVKSPLLVCRNSGRLRYVDLGFFSPDLVLKSGRNADFVITPDILAPLQRLRPAVSDKRSFGHLFLIGGSRHYPGAILMAVQAALRGGAGLVSAYVPESLAPSFAATAPEAMWVGCPETPSGGLALEAYSDVASHVARASAIAIGPGLGREPETLALVERVIKAAEVPLLLDADALQPALVKEGRAPRVLTPHAGEYLRIAGGRDLRTFATQSRATVIFKGPVTQIAQGDRIFHSFFGGPVLARGGSGDLLAGLVGAMLAQSPKDTLAAALRGVALHGSAADVLAQTKGQVAVRTTDLLDCLHQALRNHDER